MERTPKMTADDLKKGRAANRAVRRAVMARLRKRARPEVSWSHIDGGLVAYPFGADGALLRINDGKARSVMLMELFAGPAEDGFVGVEELDEQFKHRKHVAAYG